MDLHPAHPRNLAFAPLSEEDLPLLYTWLRKPHIREFYHQKTVPPWEEMRADYLRRLHPLWPTRCFLARAGTAAIGYIQVYRVSDYPEYAALIGESHGISLDLFIGEPEFLGKGWGRLILSQFLHDIAFPLFPEEQVCWIYHDARNRRARHASMAAGFQPVRSFHEEGDLKELFFLHRAGFSRNV